MANFSKAKAGREKKVGLNVVQAGILKAYRKFTGRKVY